MWGKHVDPVDCGEIEPCGDLSALAEERSGVTGELWRHSLVEYEISQSLPRVVREGKSR